MVRKPESMILGYAIVLLSIGITLFVPFVLLFFINLFFPGEFDTCNYIIGLIGFILIFMAIWTLFDLKKKKQNDKDPSKFNKTLDKIDHDNDYDG